MNDGEKLLSVEQTAARLSISTMTVRRYAYSGQLKAVKLGTRLLFRESDIQQFIENCEPLHQDECSKED